MAHRPRNRHFTYKEQGRAFEDVGKWDDQRVSITGREEPEQVEAMRVTDGVFPMLRLRPLVGRLFTPEDDSPGSPETVILGYGYWNRRFGGDPDVVGKTLRIDPRPREIIGVLPASLRFLRHDSAVYLPFRFDRSKVLLGNFSYHGIARLRPGVTLEEANADVARMIPLAVEEFPMPAGLTYEMMRDAQFGPDVHPLTNDTLFVCPEGDVCASQRHRRTISFPSLTRVCCLSLLEEEKRRRGTGMDGQLILYLHGGMGRGDDLEKVMWYPVPKMLEKTDTFPSIVITPQCPTGEMWTDTEMLIAPLDEVIAKYPVHADRVYLMDYSMGGHGAWYLAYKHPERFAAVAPMSGMSNPWWATRLKEVPIWAFHGGNDDRVPVSETEDMVKALEKGGGHVQSTVVPDRTHRPPTMEEHEQVFGWFLKHRISDRARK